MGEQRHETVRGGDAIGERCHRGGLAIESFARGDRGPAAGEDAETPDAVDAFERVGRLRRGLEAVGGVGSAGEFDLGAQADTLVGMREQLGELGGTAPGKTFLHEGSHGGGRLGLPDLAGRKGDDAAGVVRLPARDEVGHHQAAFPVVLDVGGGDAPDQLVRLHHLHARAGGLELEGPDAGSAGGAAVIADMEVPGLGLEVTRAGVVGEARRTGGDVGGGRDDEGRLDGVLELPDLLGHPAGGRALLQADRAVERVHGLVFHLPAGIRALDDVDDARLVALVGVVVDRDAVAELVEGDLLRVAQAEVHDLEVRAVRLEAEHGAAVAGVVLLAFLGGEIKAPVADRAPDAAVVADGEAVHVVARERDANAEAVLQHLALTFDAILLGVLQHPDARDAGEIDVIIPRHDPGAGAVEHVVELLVEDPGLREDAVELLVGEETDLLRLRRHPFVGALGFPLLVQGEAVGGRRRGEVVMVPVEVIAVVLDAEAEAVGLGDVEAAIVAEGDGRRRGDAGRLMSAGFLERRAGLQGGRAFAGHAHEVAGGLGLGPATGRELHVLGRGEHEMVRRDDTPGARLIVDDAQDPLLPLELGDIPDDLGEHQSVLPDGLADDLAVHEELDGGLAGVVAAGDQKPEERMRQPDLRGGQRAGGGVAPVAGGDERVTTIVAELAVHAVDLPGDRGQAEGRTRRLPAVEAVALEGLDDLDVGREHRGA